MLAALLLTPSAQGQSLVLDFTAELDDLVLPAENEDLRATFNSVEGFNTFSGTLILPDFQDYAEGDFNVALNEGGLQLLIINDFLGGVEGSDSRFRVVNEDYDPTKPDCGSSSGCDVYNNTTGELYPVDLPAEERDGIRDTTFNFPTLSTGRAPIPTDPREDSTGALTISAGQLLSFDWGAVGAENSILASYNRTFFERREVPVRLDELTISLDELTTPELIGGTYFSRGRGTASAITIPAVAPPAAVGIPEPTSALLTLVALGAASITRRR